MTYSYVSVVSFFLLLSRAGVIFDGYLFRDSAAKTSRSWASRARQCSGGPLKPNAPFSHRLMRLARSQSGTAAVEMAVVLPMLILLAIGVAEFGRIYVKSIAVANAAIAGAA